VRAFWLLKYAGDGGGFCPFWENSSQLSQEFLILPHFTSRPICSQWFLEPNGWLQQLLCLSLSISRWMYLAWMDACTTIIGDVAMNVCKCLNKICFSTILNKNDVVNLRNLLFIFKVQYFLLTRMCKICLQILITILGVIQEISCFSHFNSRLGHCFVCRLLVSPRSDTQETSHLHWQWFHILEKV